MKTKQLFLLSILVLVSALSIQAQTPPSGDVTRTYYREIGGIFYKLRGDKAIVFERYLDYKPYFDNVVIPSTVTYQGVEYTVRAIGKNAFSGSYGLISISIPNTVTSIETGAFYGCIGLRSIRFPEGVASIGETAFTNCTGLASIYIPKTVTFIGETAFNSCSCLTSIEVEEGNPVFDSRDGCNAIIETATNALKVGCENTVIPGSVTTILDGAFGHRRYLKTIEIPNGVQAIGASFYNSGLTTISLPSNVRIINGAFQNCYNLESVAILGADITIAGFAFYGCEKLKSLTLFAPEPPKITQDTFIFNLAQITLHVLPGCEEAYEQAEYWKDFHIVGDADPTGIVRATLLSDTDDTTYDLLGRPVDSHYKGIAIRGGKKIFIK